MKNNYYYLSQQGYKDYYILQQDGKIKNTKSGKYLQIDYKYCYHLQRQDGTNKTVSLKSIYRAAFNKEFCIDNIKPLPNEVFKEIKGTGGKYFISNCGRVKSLNKYYAEILKPFENSKGYLRVNINGRKQFIHRLVAAAFLPIDNERKIIHHKDGNKKNNKLSNLQRATHSENTQYYYLSVAAAKGENNDK